VPILRQCTTSTSGIWPRHDTNRLGETYGLSWCTASPSVPFPAATKASGCLRAFAETVWGGENVQPEVSVIRRGCYGKISSFPLSHAGTPPSRPNSHAISNLCRYVSVRWLRGRGVSRPFPTPREHLERIPESLIEVLSLDAEAEALAAEYIRDGAVGKSQRADALHIAIATTARVDVLVSWNFKHIVNLRRIHAFNAVNLKQGYPVLEIRNPREVIGDE